MERNLPELDGCGPQFFEDQPQVVWPGVRRVANRVAEPPLVQREQVFQAQAHKEAPGAMPAEDRRHFPQPTAADPFKRLAGRRG